MLAFIGFGISPEPPGGLYQAQLWPLQPFHRGSYPLPLPPQFTDIFRRHLIRSLSSVLTRNTSQIVLICLQELLFATEQTNARASQVPVTPTEVSSLLYLKAIQCVSGVLKCFLLSPSDGLGTYPCAMSVCWTESLTCIKYYWRSNTAPWHLLTLPQCFSCLAFLR